MKTKPEFIYSSLALLLLALVFWKSTALALPDNPEQTILGYVVVAAWNDDLQIGAVAIRQVAEFEVNADTPEQVREDYLVGDTEKGHELMKLVGKLVKARGIIQTDEYGDKTIFVTEYKVIESGPDSKATKEQPPRN